LQFARKKTGWKQGKGRTYVVDRIVGIGKVELVEQVERAGLVLRQPIGPWRTGQSCPILCQ
jgi:hypothetical protein